jgi:signal transduction histidine kinase
MTDRRDLWLLSGWVGWALVLTVVAGLAFAETFAHRFFDGAAIPWLHLGVAAGFTLWGGYRLIPPAAFGALIGLAFGWFVAGPDSTTTAPIHHIWAVLLQPLADAIGLTAMMLAVGRSRRPLVDGRVELESAMRFVGLGIPAAAIPSIALVVGILTALGHPLDITMPQAVAAGLGGVFASAPMVISMLPTRTHLTAYRCHCKTPVIPMIAMGLLIPIGLMPLFLGADPFRTVAISSVLAIGVLGWLSIASGWMATSGGIMIVTITTLVAVLKVGTQPDALHGGEIVAMLPAAFIGLLFASTMEARFRDQHALTEQHDELRTLVNATGVAMFRTDPAGRVVHANAVGHELAADGARFGDPIERWFPAAGGRKLQRAIERVVEGRPCEFELTVERDARNDTHHAVCGPLTDDRGILRGISIVLVDMRIRERRERAARRRRAEQTQSVASALVHDINNLAMAIGGAASLARESSDDTAVGRVFERIEQQCEDASRRSLRVRHLATASIGAGRSIDLSTLLGERLRTMSATRGMIVESMVIEPELAVNIDPAIAEFIIDEFVQNAIDAADGVVPSISMSIGRSFDDPAMVELTLADDGPGISGELQPDVGRRIVSTKGHGRGFGLRQIFKSVKRVGGTARIESSNRGTTLRVRLPHA